MGQRTLGQRDKGQLTSDKGEGILGWASWMLGIFYLDLLMEVRGLKRKEEKKGKRANVNRHKTAVETNIVNIDATPIRV